MASVVSICNEALSEIAADTITSIDEASVSATHCSRAFESVVSDLLERGDWGFKTRRVAGAAVTNDRARDWTYAYAKPADAAKVLRILPPITEVYPEWGAYDAPLWDVYGPIPFVEENGVVFGNVADAVLEYAASSVDVSAFPSLFRRAVAMELAARVAMPIKKDRAIKGDMIQQAEVALQRAIADDRNRYPRRQTDYVSEVELVRAGYREP